MPAKRREITQLTDPYPGTIKRYDEIMRAVGALRDVTHDLAEDDNDWEFYFSEMLEDNRRQMREIASLMLIRQTCDVVGLARKIREDFHAED